MNAQDRDYYLKRAGEEDEAARASVSLSARWRHEELASLYRLRLMAFDRTAVREEPEGTVQPFILVPSPGQTEAA
jgi:hypothetical protein